MDDFKEYAIIEKSNDPVVNNFFVKYNIMAMYIEPGHKDSHKCPFDNLFKNCGNIISFRFNDMFTVSPNHSLIFDYSNEGLELTEGFSTRKYKIADGVFVF